MAKNKKQYENTVKLDRVAASQQIKEIPQCAYDKVERRKKSKN